MTPITLVHFSFHPQTGRAMFIVGRIYGLEIKLSKCDQEDKSANYLESSQEKYCIVYCPYVFWMIRKIIVIYFYHYLFLIMVFSIVVQKGEYLDLQVP